MEADSKLNEIEANKQEINSEKEYFDDQSIKNSYNAQNPHDLLTENANISSL